MSISAKLTLRLDKQLIQRAKSHSEKIGKSVSQLVADYFMLLDEEVLSGFANLPPITRSLKGLLRGKKISKADYHRYLEDKYL